MYVESRKMVINDRLCKTEIETEKKYMDTTGRKEDGMNWEVGIDLCTPLILCIK